MIYGVARVLNAVALSHSGPTYMSAKDTFNNKWIPVPESGCWLWTHSTHKSGYGQIFVRNRRTGLAKNVRAHRMSWEIYKGKIPDGMCVCHKCDVALCVNPDHLYLGDHIGNMRDMSSRRRAESGINRYNSKLNVDAIKDIRNSNLNGAELSRKYKVSQSLISQIKSNKIWRHAE